MENEIKSSVLDIIGNTPIIALDRLYKAFQGTPDRLKNNWTPWNNLSIPNNGTGRILVKCEFVNPGASIKDRTALAMILDAKKSGKLLSGGHVVEMSSGNQGSGLAVVCSVLGHPLTVTMSKGNSPQRAVMMRGLGANVEIVDQVNGVPGSVTLEDREVAMKRAEKIVSETDGYFVHQLTNDYNYLAHKMTTGPEIWKQTGGRIDVFLTCVGTAGTFRGTSEYLKEMNPNIKCIAVEPTGSEPIKGAKVVKPLHILQGAGRGAIPPLFTYDVLDGTIDVTDEESIEYRNLLGSKERLYVGLSSAANVAAAVKLLNSGRINSDSWIVTILYDSGMKYDH